MKAEAWVAISQKVSEERVTFLLRRHGRKMLQFILSILFTQFKLLVSTCHAICDVMWTANTFLSTLFRQSSAHLAVDKDQDLALLVPLSQHLKETREALFLWPNLNNLINISIDHTSTSHLQQAL